MEFKIKGSKKRVVHIGLIKRNRVLKTSSAKQNCSRRHSNCILLFLVKIRVNISRESSARQTIYLKYHALFYRKK